MRRPGFAGVNVIDSVQVAPSASVADAQFDVPVPAAKSPVGDPSDENFHAADCSCYRRSDRDTLIARCCAYRLRAELRMGGDCGQQQGCAGQEAD